MAGTYSYDPAKLEEEGKDFMRFQLGDTMVEGKEKTCALTDEEYNAILKMHSNWKRAKLACIESIFRRFSYEPDTATGPLSFQFGARAKLWREEYEKLKKDLSKSSPFCRRHISTGRMRKTTVFLYRHDVPRKRGRLI